MRETGFSKLIQKYIISFRLTNTNIEVGAGRERHLGNLVHLSWK